MHHCTYLVDDAVCFVQAHHPPLGREQPDDAALVNECLEDGQHLLDVPHAHVLLEQRNLLGGAHGELAAVLAE